MMRTLLIVTFCSIAAHAQTPSGQAAAGQAATGQAAASSGGQRFKLVTNPLVLPPGKDAQTFRVSVNASGLPLDPKNRPTPSLQDANTPASPAVVVTTKFLASSNEAAATQLLQFEVNVSGFPPAESQTRMFIVSYGDLHEALSYTLTNVASKTFTWTVKAPPEWNAGSMGALPIAIRTGEIPATSVTLFQADFVSDDKLKQTAGRQDFALCVNRDKKTGCTSLSASLPERSPATLFVVPTGKLPYGTLKGNLSLFAAEKTEPEVLPVTEQAISPDARVPSKMQGGLTDVVESPMARLAACTDDRQKKVRPLIGGVSVSRAGGRSGTLGAFVRSTRASDPKDGVLLLSNSHVLAPESGRVAGTEVVQSSTDDGEAEVVGTLLRATRLHRTVPITADAAVAQVAPGVGIRNEICIVGAVSGAFDPRQDMEVEKHGRSSGHTRGRIAAIGITAQVNDDERGIELTFVDLFRVEPLAGIGGVVADLGDSGSLVVEKDSRKAGLLHAADELGTFYFAHPITQVFRELDIELDLG